jgi:hypothetical protein
MRGGHWLALFGLILLAWTALYVMALPEEVRAAGRIYGAEFLASLCTVTPDAAGDEPVLVVEVTDRFGVVTYLHAIIDGGEPVRFLPEDGLHDQLTETFRLPVAGASTILIEAYDQNGNAALHTWRGP